MSEFHFRLISSEQLDRILRNFVYALILTRSKCVVSKLAAELWPLIDADFDVYAHDFNSIKSIAAGL